MKITMRQKAPTRTYPYIGVYHSTGHNRGMMTFVKFVSANTGVLLWTDRTDCSPTNLDWKEELYQVYDGELVLENTCP